jgi:hypothetical protein
MPIIAGDGFLFPRLFVQIKQPGGAFPRNKRIFQAPNLAAVAGKTHIMTIQTYLTFLRECLIPYLPDRSLLLLDSWPGFGNVQTRELLNNLPGKEVQIRRIPPHTTSICQPLDRYGFRQWKSIVKHIDDHIILCDIAIPECVRDRELKRHSLIHNQLSAPCFRPMWQYSFHSAGLHDEHPGPFLGPMEVLFPTTLNLSTCPSNNCQDPPFIKCAHCENVFCFQHFYGEHHYHDLV